jgi:putative component of toxin-antitoxin plasmid stabilization module
MLELRGYVDRKGGKPFACWLESLDASAAAKVTMGLTRIELGNFSNVKSVGSGVYEHEIASALATGSILEKTATSL